LRRCSTRYEGRLDYGVVGALKDERVAVIDWANPAANDFFLASQVWIESNL
jgi:type I site-specific restriction-modification system R (restriction) subunit